MNFLFIYRLELSMIDLKCSIVNDSQCWYCEDLCDSCLNRSICTISEVTLVGEKSTELKLCNENNSKLCKISERNSEVNLMKQVVYILTPDGKVICSSQQSLSLQEVHKYCGLRCAPVQSIHEEMLHLYLLTFLDNHWYSLSIEELSLCHGTIAGQDCLYAVYFKRGFMEQSISLEFLVSQDLVPSQLLPYYGSSDPSAIEALEEVQTSANVLQLLQAAKVHVNLKL